MKTILSVLDNVRNALKPFYLVTYRTGAFAIIASSLLFAASWGIIIFFFLFNNSWIAPTVLTSSSDRALQFNQGLAMATQTIETDKVTLAQAQRDLVFANKNVELLQTIQGEMVAYIRSHNALKADQKVQIASSEKLARDLSSVKDNVIQSRRQGLIDNQSLVVTSTYVQQFNNALLEQKQSMDTLQITIQAQVLQMSEQLRQAQNDVHTKEETVLAATTSLGVAQQAFDNLKKSVYFDAFNDTKDNLNLAFIPYEGLSNAKVGASIYQCTLEIIWCHKVGTVRHIYHDEQLVDFPIFNVKLSRTVRGVFISVNINDKDAVQERVLFIDKPLWL